MSRFPLTAHRRSPRRLRAGAIATAGALGLVVAAPGALATAGDDWQLRRLFDPTEAQLESERRGGVFIYDGLRDTTVQRAMKEEFDRLDHMMFTNTIVTDDAGKPKRDPETGAWIRQDDGC